MRRRRVVDDRERVRGAPTRCRPRRCCARCRRGRPGPDSVVSVRVGTVVAAIRLPSRYTSNRRKPGQVVAAARVPRHDGRVRRRRGGRQVRRRRRRRLVEQHRHRRRRRRRVAGPVDRAHGVDVRAVEADGVVLEGQARGRADLRGAAVDVVVVEPGRRRTAVGGGVPRDHRARRRARAGHVQRRVRRACGRRRRRSGWTRPTSCRRRRRPARRTCGCPRAASRRCPRRSPWTTCPSGLPSRWTT